MGPAKVVEAGQPGGDAESQDGRFPVGERARPYPQILQGEIVHHALVPIREGENHPLAGTEGRLLSLQMEDHSAGLNDNVRGGGRRGKEEGKKPHKDDKPPCPPPLRGRHPTTKSPVAYMRPMPEMKP